MEANGVPVMQGHRHHSRRDQRMTMWLLVALAFVAGMFIGTLVMAWQIDRACSLLSKGNEDA